MTGTDPCRAPDITVEVKIPVGLQLYLGIDADKMRGALPVRGRAAAIEHARFGEDIGARADTGDTDATLDHGSHEAKRLFAGRRRPHPLASRHDQGCDRAGRPETAR